MSYIVLGTWLGVWFTGCLITFGSLIALNRRKETDKTEFLDAFGLSIFWFILVPFSLLLKLGSKIEGYYNKISNIAPEKYNEYEDDEEDDDDEDDFEDDDDDYLCEEVERRIKEAYKEGYDKGKLEGFAAGLADKNVRLTNQKEP